MINELKAAQIFASWQSRYNPSVVDLRFHVGARILLDETSSRGELYRALMGEGKKSNGKGDIAKELQAAFFVAGPGAIGYTHGHMQQGAAPISRALWDSIAGRLADRFNIAPRSRMIHAVLIDPNDPGTVTAMLSGSNLLDIARCRVEDGQVAELHIYEAKGGALSQGAQQQVGIDENWRMNEHILRSWDLPERTIEALLMKDLSDNNVLHSNIRLSSLVPAEREIISRTACARFLQHYLTKGGPEARLIYVGADGQFHEMELTREALARTFSFDIKIICLANPKVLAKAPDSVQAAVRREFGAQGITLVDHRGSPHYRAAIDQCRFRAKDAAIIAAAGLGPLPSCSRIFVDGVPAFFGIDGSKRASCVRVRDADGDAILIPVRRLMYASPLMNVEIRPREQPTG